MQLVRAAFMHVVVKAKSRLYKLVQRLKTENLSK
jgi:hypothetical protein